MVSLRIGFDDRIPLGSPLQLPEAAIDPSEDAVSISAAMVLRDQFAQDSPAVRTFFDALVALITGSGRKQYVEWLTLDPPVAQDLR